MSANKTAPPDQGVFICTRAFNASLARVWTAWSEAEQLQAWWGPKGCKLTVAGLEFRPGGFFHYAMKYSNGPKMWGRFMYREIVPQQRIVWLNSFSNEGCGITRAPFDITFPLEMRNEVTFIEQDGKTTVTLRATPHGETDQERQVFEGMFPSLELGYGGTLDQLAEVVEKA